MRRNEASENVDDVKVALVGILVAGHSNDWTKAVGLLAPLNKHLEKISGVKDITQVSNELREAAIMVERYGADSTPEGKKTVVNTLAGHQRQLSQKLSTELRIILAPSPLPN